MLKVMSVVGFLSILLLFSVALPLPSQGDPESFRHSRHSRHSRQWGYQALYAWVRYIAREVEYPAPDTALPDMYQLTKDQPKQFKKAVAAYFWGLPLVEMRRTQQAVLDRYNLDPNDLYNSNLRNTGDSVVAPNLDVLNSTSFIDFSDPKLAGPPAFVLSVPDTRQHVDNGRGTFTIMQVLDAYTNVVDALGTCVDPCTEGDDIPLRNEGGHYLLSGPTYTGEIPDQFEDVILGEVKIPTAQAWLIGRTQVDAYFLGCPPPFTTGQSTQYENEAIVRACPDGFDLSADKSWGYSKQYTLTSLQDFERDPDSPTKPVENPTNADGTPRVPERKEGTCPSDPVNFPMFGEEVAEPASGPGLGAVGDEACLPADPTTPTTTPHWSTQNFLEYLGDSVQQNGITEGNKRIFRQFRSLGLTRGGYQPSGSTDNGDVHNGIYAASLFLGFLAAHLDSIPGPSDTNWSINAELGNYDPNPPGWLTATTVAAVGLGANRAEDGIYPLTVKDACGLPLDGANDYTLTFSAADQKFPPVNIEYNEDGSSSPLGFWSLTVYTLPDGRIVTPQDGGSGSFYGDEVYSLGSTQVENLRGEFVPSEDVTFHFQQESPSREEELPYWLPVPEGDFEVILRIYAPDMSRFTPLCDILLGADCYLPPELVRVPATLCEREDPDNPDVDRPRIPRRIRRMIDRLDIEGDFLSGLR